MRIDDFDKPLNEAMPMGSLSSIGQKLRAKLPGLGAEMAKGKLEVGTLANEIIKAYYKYLGTQPKTNQQPTSQNLINFLKQSQYPVQGAIKSLKSPVAEAGPRPAMKASERLAKMQQAAAAKNATAPTAPAGAGAMGQMAGQLAKGGPATLPNTMANAPVSKTNTAQAGNPNVTPTTPTTPTTPSRGVLNAKQINAAIMAASSDIINQVSPQSYTPQVSATTSGPSPSSQGLGAAFKAGFSGDRMPNSTQSNRLDFSDANSVNNVIQQMNKFRQSGGKLDPNTKSTLQKLINQL
jgi:hypothetical protein